MKNNKFRKENIIHLAIAVAAVVLLAVGLWSGKKYYNETADLRQVESDMQALRDDLQDYLEDYVDKLNRDYDGPCL